MKRTVMTATAALMLLLGGCATTIRSDVTTFHQWPAELQDKTYVFEAPPAQEDTLELRSYQNLVRGELARLGFRDAGTSAPTLLVSMRFSTTDMPVRVIEAADPFFYSSARFDFRRPYSRRGYRGGGFYSPYYDPFVSIMPSYQVSIEHNYKRELQVAISSAFDKRRLFDVTVHNLSSQMSTPAVMPALVQSAFVGFPGPNGVARRVELKQEG